MGLVVISGLLAMTAGLYLIEAGLLLFFVVAARFAHRLAHPVRARRASLGRLMAAATIGVLVSAPVVHAEPRCGEERAIVKLGLDEEAKRIDLEPASTTVYDLVNLPRPGRIPESTRASDVERTVWRVEATVTAYKLEHDGDIHIVISDGARTMIVEIPDPDCAAPGAWGPEIKIARESFLRLLADRGFPAPTARLHRTIMPVRATGVGFFDRVHGQAGVAKPSGIELHPLLSIETGGGSS